MLIDAHCHLPTSLQETKLLLQEATDAGVTKLIDIGTSLKLTKRAIQIAGHFDNVYATGAIYPHDDKDIPLEKLMLKLESLLTSSKKVVAVGECGIDITNWYGGRTKAAQVELLEAHLQLALKLKFPVVLHNRNGDSEILELLIKYKDAGLQSVFHCFSSTWEFAKKILDLGCYVSFSGMITYPSRRELLETVKNIPLDRFMVETDAPYLPPQGHRGEQNRPKYVIITAQKIAEIRKIPYETIATAAYKNTCRFFRL